MTAYNYEQNIVIDLEFTPLDVSFKKQGLCQEIIEIGAVRVNENGQIIDTFQSFVKPEISDGVAKKITRLTGITDRYVTDAPNLEETLKEFSKWVGGSAHTRFVAWSKSDKNQIKAECAYKNIALPTNFNRWMDLQVVFPRLMKVKGRRKLMKLDLAAEAVGIEMDNSDQHRALYDASITAELFKLVLNDEYKAHQEAVRSVLRDKKSADKPLSATIGSMNSALAELYARLMAQETALQG